MYCSNFSGWFGGWGPWAGQGFGGAFFIGLLGLAGLFAVLFFLRSTKRKGTAEPLHRCPHCSGEILSVYFHCPHCGKQLKSNCPDCSRVVDHRWSFCPHCNRDLASNAETISNA